MSGNSVVKNRSGLIWLLWLWWWLWRWTWHRAKHSLIERLSKQERQLLIISFTESGINDRSGNILILNVLNSLYSSIGKRSFNNNKFEIQKQNTSGWFGLLLMVCYITSIIPNVGHVVLHQWNILYQLNECPV